MAHLRQQIRDDLVSDLTGLAGITSASSNRAKTLQESQLPALVIQTTTDQADYSQGQMNSIPMHLLGVQIEVYVKDVPELELQDTLDDFAVLIDQQIYSASATFNDKVVGVERDNTEFLYEQEGDQPTGYMAINYIFYYFAKEGDPETVIS